MKYVKMLLKIKAKEWFVSETNLSQLKLELTLIQNSQTLSPMDLELARRNMNFNTKSRRPNPKSTKILSRRLVSLGFRRAIPTLSSFMPRSKLDRLQTLSRRWFFDDPQVIKNEAIDFFTDLFSSQDIGTNIQTTIPSKKILSPKGRSYLEKPISFEELEGVVMEGDPDKAPGPDGFTFNFFQKNVEYHQR